MGQSTSNMIVCGVVDEEESSAALDAVTKDWFMCHKLVFCRPLAEMDEKRNRIVIDARSSSDNSRENPNNLKSSGEAVTGSFLIYQKEMTDDNATAKQLCNAPLTCAEIEPNPDVELVGPPEPLDPRGGSRAHLR